MFLFNYSPYDIGGDDDDEYIYDANAPDDDDDGAGDYDDYDDSTDDDEGEVGEDSRSKSGAKKPLTVEEVNEIVQDRLARDRRSRDKELAQQLGVSPKEAREWIEAGRAVSQASGLTPAQIRERIAQDRANQGGNNNQQTYQHPAGGGFDPNLRTELEQIKSVLYEDREEKVKQLESERGRKEFGKLFDKYSDDIEDKAEELGLPLDDAAAIVLRPKLREYYSQQAANRAKHKRQRGTVGADDRAVESRSAVSELTPKEKEIAQKMGLTEKEYAENKF